MRFQFFKTPARFPTRTLAALVTVVLIAGQQAHSQSTVETSNRTRVIVMDANKLSKTSRQILEQASGRIGGEKLEMTGAEMWWVNKKYTDQLQHLADEQGVKIKYLDPAFTQIMRPAGASTKLTDRQKELLAKAKSSDASTRITVLDASSPEQMEYALGQGLKPQLMGRSPKTQREIAKMQSQSEITLPLSSGKSITIKRTHMEPTKSGCVWTGLIAGTKEPVTLMWWGSGRLAGSFTHENKSYTIKNLGDMRHVVIETDPAMLPPDHGIPTARKSNAQLLTKFGDASMVKRAKPTAEQIKHALDKRSTSKPMKFDIGRGSNSGSTLRPKTAVPPVKVDVMVGYTAKAAKHFSDIDKDLISLAVEQTNHTFRTSGIHNVEINLVGSFQADYDESDGSHFDHVWRLADKRDGYMDPVHALRDEKKADIVLLIVDDPSGCGLATRVAGEADEAFAVVHHGCATTSFSFAHEIGHIFGARHDRALDQSTRPFPYGHGHVDGKDWRTIMAYRNSCGDCPRVPVWSNPSVTVRGKRAGDANTHNARVMKERAERVANFR